MITLDWEKEDTIDTITGIRLTPSLHGINCTGNGEHPDKECCCDACDYFLICFPEWDPRERRQMECPVKGE